MRDIHKWKRIYSAVRAGLGETTMHPGFSGAPKRQRRQITLTLAMVTEETDLVKQATAQEDQ